VTWWVVALVLLGRISPPFLDFIESSGVTTQWTSLTEVLRDDPEAKQRVRDFLEGRAAKVQKA
jgi:hypothetical protein